MLKIITVRQCQNWYPSPNSKQVWIDVYGKVCQQ